MTDADKIMHLHFGTDPNKSENPDSNPGSLLFQMLVLVELVLLFFKVILQSPLVRMSIKHDKIKLTVVVATQFMLSRDQCQS